MREPTSTSARLRALFVEDDPGDAELAIRELRRGGYDVVFEQVATEDEMRAALSRSTWDVVLSDVALPAFSGTAALAVLEDCGLDVPFIVITGTVGEEVAISAMKAGACDVIAKGHLARLCPAIERERREAAVRADQRKMQEKLLIADRMASVGTLAAGVAHEINNPLAAVIANIELAARDLTRFEQDPDPERLKSAHEELADAREAAERLRHIVRDLKVFSHTPDANTGPVDVKRVIESSLRMAWNEIRHRARLVKEYDVVPPVDANEARLGQVFLNLIVNAAQAIDAGDVEHHTLRVTTRMDEGGRVAIEFRDSGVGIKPEDLPHIFDAFFTTKPAGVGTGLGLPICHKIVTALGGSIEVESRLGMGSTFRVLLPPSKAALEPKPAPTPSARADALGRVLVIDDDVAVGRTIARTLHGHDVVTVTTGAAALQHISRGEAFDVILCDLMMPQMTGMELHAELLRARPELAERMVFLTGGAFTPAAQRFLETVENQRVEKPFDPQHLRALVAARVK